MVHLTPTVSDVQTLAAYVIFLARYLVFALGKFPGLKIDRPGAAIICAVGMVAFRVVQPADTLRKGERWIRPCHDQSQISARLDGSPIVDPYFRPQWLPNFSLFKYSGSLWYPVRPAKT